MATNRKLVFVNNYYYHVFNRGLDKRITFSSRNEYARGIELLTFYQYAHIPYRFSQYKNLNQDKQNHIMETMVKSGKIVDIMAYCLMPNHFHILVKQRAEHGIATYIANITNAYTKYYNTKHHRTGPLFQGVFKAVFVETEEQLLHLTRYIHLNPVIASIVENKSLEKYPWSSLTSYLSLQSNELIEKDEISFIVDQIPNYRTFILDQIDYGKELKKIEHITLDN